MFVYSIEDELLLTPFAVQHVGSTKMFMIITMMHQWCLHSISGKMAQNKIISPMCSCMNEGHSQLKECTCEERERDLGVGDEEDDTSSYYD